MKHHCKGLFSFIATPTAKNGSIDLSRLNTLADEQIAAGVDGLTLFGSTGGIGSFNEAERKEAAASLIRHVARRVPVMIGTGAITTDEAIRLSEHAEASGADIVLVVPITYWLLSEREIIDHYTAIAHATGLPVTLYNNPRLTGVDIVPSIVARLAQMDNVIAIKEAAPDLLRIPQLLRAVPDKMRIFAGRDVTAFESMSLGARDWASAMTNIAPARCVAFYRLMASGQREQARVLWNGMLRLVSFAMERGLIRACHTAFEIKGQSIGRPRAPLGPLSLEDAKQLESLMNELEREPTMQASYPPTVAAE